MVAGCHRSLGDSDVQYPLVDGTMTDLQGADLIDTPHIAEALRYRERECDWQEGYKTERDVFPGGAVRVGGPP